MDSEEKQCLYESSELSNAKLREKIEVIMKVYLSIFSKY